MSKYVDLVLVKFDDTLGLNLSYAPFMSGINTGDKVIVHTFQGENLGEAVAVESVETGSEEMEFIKLAASKKEPDQIMSHAVPFDYSEFEYESALE